MVLPPNRIGALRGPNGSTIDDVVDAINGLIAVQQAQAITLESMRNFLDNIADDAARIVTQVSPTLTPISSWDGVRPITLAELLDWSIGGISDYDNVQAQLNQLRGQINSLDARLEGINILISGNSSTDNTPPLENANNNVLEKLAKLVEAVGIRGTSPTNLSALAYLALIADSTERAADCCEEGQPGGGGENPPPGPSFSCGLESTPFRATSYEFRRNLPADQLDEYIVMFTGFSSQSPSGFTETISNDTVPLPCYEGPANAQLCWEWNLSSGQVPGQLLVYESSPGGLFAPVIGTNVGVTQGEGSTSILTLAGAGEKYMLCVRVAENSGVPQHLNYWIDRNGPPS